MAAAAKASLEQKQAEEKASRMLELERKKIELEMGQHQLELQYKLEMTRLEAENQLSEARNKAEMARLEVELAEREEVEIAKASPLINVTATLPARADVTKDGASPKDPQTSTPVSTTVFKPTFQPSKVQFTPMADAPRYPTSCITNESLLTTIASAMEQINLTQDLPRVEVQKFDGSAEKFPVFRQRFKQMVESTSR